MARWRFKGFQLLPRRWVVDRSFAWLGRSRRLAKDFEATVESSTAWVHLANLRLLSRRLAQPTPSKTQPRKVMTNYESASEEAAKRPSRRTHHR
jgi:hypothetical protein